MNKTVAQKLFNILSLSRLFLVLFLFFTIFLFPHSTSADLYAPGATLDPDCSMGSPDCGVIFNYVPYTGASSTVNLNNQELDNISGLFVNATTTTAGLNISNLSNGILTVNSEGNVSTTSAATIGSSVQSLSQVGVVNPGYTVTNNDFPITVTSFMAVSGGYAYLPNIVDNGLDVYDVSNPAFPTLVASTTVGDSPTGIALSGNYAYVVNENDNDISVVDISNPLVPVEVATTSVGNNPYAIALSGNYAYVTNSNDNDISVVDISNPLVPVEVATTTVGNNPQDIGISGNYAYVVNENDNDISVVDISNPLVPVQVATVAAGSGPQKIVISGNYAYVTDTGSNSIFILNISNPTSPTFVDIISVPSYPSSIGISGDYAYVTYLGYNAISIIDISDPTNPIITNQFGVGFQIGGYEHAAIVVSGNYAYAAAYGGGSSPLSIFDISNPADPRMFGAADIGDTGSGNDTVPLDIAASGNYLYTANVESNSMSVIDVSNPLLPTLVASTTLPLPYNDSDVEGIAVSGNYAYLTNGGGGILSVVDISNPLDPAEVATTSVDAGSSEDIKVSGNYAYVLDPGDGTLSVVDISNPLNPTVVATTTVEQGNGGSDFSISGNYLYDIGYQGYLSVTDISNPLDPVQVATTTLYANVSAISISGNYVYVSSGYTDTDDLFVFNISNPTNPTLINTIDIGNELPYQNDQIENISISNGTLYLMDDQDGLYAFNISDPIYATLTAQVENENQAEGGFVDTFVVSNNYIYANFYNDVVMSIAVNNGGGSLNTQVLNTNTLNANTLNANTLFTATTTTNSLNVNNLTNTLLAVNGNGTVVAASTTGLLAGYITNGEYDNLAYRYNTLPQTYWGNPPAVLSTTSVSQAANYGTWDGQDYWIGQWGAQTISEINENGTLLATYDLGSSLPQPLQLAFDGRYIWIADSDCAGDLGKFDPVTDTVVATYSLNPTCTGAGGLQGVMWDGSHLWVAIAGLNEVAEVDPNTGAIIASTTGQSNVNGLAYTYQENANGTGTTEYIWAANGSNVGKINANTMAYTLIDGGGGYNFFQDVYRIATDGTYIYAADWGNSDVAKIDAATDNIVAQWDGGGAVAGPNDVAFDGNHIWVANSDGSNDVFDTDTGDLLADLPDSGGASLTFDGSYMWGVNGNTGQVFKMSIGNQMGNLKDSQTLSVMDNDANTNIFLNGLGGSYFLGNVGIGGLASNNALTVSGNILDTTSNPENVAQIATTTVGNSPKNIAVSGNYAYVANTADNTISVVDISNPEAPIQLATAGVGTFPDAIAVSGNYAYVANGNSDTMSVVDISNPSDPVQVATADVGGSPTAIAVSGNYVYVLAYDSAIVFVYNISNPMNPVQVGSISIGNSPQGIAVSGNYAYVADTGNNTVSVVDISNPSDPVQVGSVNVGSDPVGIAVSGNYVYTANNQSNTMSIVDVSNPTAPVQVATAPVGYNPWGLALSGNYAYVSNSNSNTVSVIDITDSIAPDVIATTAVGNVPYGIAASSNDVYLVNFNDNTMSVINASTTNEGGNITAEGSIAAGTSLAVTGINIPSYFDDTIGIGTTTPATAASIAGITTTEGLNISGLSNGLLDVDANGNIGATNAINITSTSGSISQSGTAFVGTSDSPAAPIYVAVSGNYAYTTNSGNNSMSVVNISNPADPVEMGTTTTGGAPLGIAISGDYAYVADQSGTISVIDISNPSSPVQVASTTLAAEGLRGIAISGNYAYVVSSNDGTVSVIDISNPLAPTTVTSVTVGNGPYNIAISGTDAYVTNIDDNTVSVIDISTPTSPTVVDTVNVGGYNPWGITVSGNYVYTANVGGFPGTVSIINVSNPASATLVGTVSVGQDLQAITASGSNVYVTGPGFDGIGVINASDPANPTVSILGGTGYSTFGLASFGNYVYLVNSQDEGYLQTLDISNPQSPSIFGVAQLQNTGGSGHIIPQGIAISGTYAYVANVSADTMSVINIANPALPSQIATTSVESDPYGIAVSGTYAYVANQGSDSMSVVDVSNPESPTQVGVTDLDSSPYDVAVSGNYAYLTESNGNIPVVNISNPTSPAVVDTLSGVGNTGIAVSGNDVYALDSSDNTLSVIDISDPASPVQVGTATVGNGAESIAISGNYAYVINDIDNTISVVDISNPSSPTVVQTVSTASGQQDLAVSGNSLYVISGQDVSLFDISNPSSPVFVSSTQIPTFSGLNHIAISGNNAYVTEAGSDLVASINIMTPEVSIVNLLVSNLKISSLADDSYLAVDANGNIVATSTLVGLSTGYVPYTGASSTVNLNDQELTNIQSLTTLGLNISDLSSGLLDLDSNGNVGTTNAISIISSSTSLESDSLNFTSNGLVEPYDLAISGNYAYIGGANGTIYVFDISNPSSLSLVASTTISMSGSYLTDFAISGNYLYVGNDQNDTINVIDISNPLAPTQVATTTIGNEPGAIAISGNYAYVTNGNSILYVLDISSPTSPTQVATINIGNDAGASIIISGNYLYLNQGSAFSVVDISNPLVPVNIMSTSTLLTTHSFQALASSGNYLYVADGDLFVYDVSNPASPVQVATTSLPFSATAISISGNYVYLYNEQLDNTVSVVNISNPLAPAFVNTLQTQYVTDQMAISGNYGYIMGAWESDLDDFGITSLTIATTSASSIYVSALSVNSTTIPSNGVAYFNGSIGIGTSTPSDILTVVASTTGQIELANSSSTGYWTIGPNGSNEFTVYNENGNGMYMTDGGTSWTANSDERLKTNITTLPGTTTLADVLALNPVTFNWIATSSSQAQQVGFIAQEVDAAGLGDLVVPPENPNDCVPGSSTENDCYGLDYDRFAPYLVAAIQQQQDLIQANASSTTAMQTIVNEVGSIISNVADGIGYLTNIAIQNITVGSQNTPAGITMYDQVTGEPYCVVIKDGVLVNEPGVCGNSSASSTPSSDSSDDSSGSSSSESTSTISLPTITSINPTTGSTAGGDTLTITGTDFLPGATVTVGGASASVSSISADGTTITATTPSGTAGAVDITVINTDTGSTTLAGGFTYADQTSGDGSDDTSPSSSTSATSSTISLPTITSINPTTGSTAGGDTLTITGTDFLPGATVTVGGASASVSSISADGTTITATTPSGTAGAVDITVINTDTGSTTLAGGFTYFDPTDTSSTSATSTATTTGE